MATMEQLQGPARLGHPIVTSPQHAALLERIAKGEVDTVGHLVASGLPFFHALSLCAVHTVAGHG
jgi:hypothetical protein